MSDWFDEFAADHQNAVGEIIDAGHVNALELAANQLRSTLGPRADLLDGESSLVERLAALVAAEIARADGAYAGLVFDMPYTVHPGLMSANQAITSGRTRYWRSQGSGTISKIGLVVGNSAGNICVAAYRNTGARRNAQPDPANRIATSGSLACPSSGYNEVSLGGSVDVKAGDWLSLSASDISATFGAVAVGPTSTDITKGFAYESTDFPAPSGAFTSLTNLAGRLVALVGVE